LVDKLEGMTPLGILRYRWEQNIKATFQTNKMGMWTEFSILVHRTATVNTVMGFCVPLKAGDFLTSYVTFTSGDIRSSKQCS